MAQAQAGLLSRDAVTNARALLRYALPIDERSAKPMRQVQVALCTYLHVNLPKAVEHLNLTFRYLWLFTGIPMHFCEITQYWRNFEAG